MHISMKKLVLILILLAFALSTVVPTAEAAPVRSKQSVARAKAAQQNRKHVKRHTRKVHKKALRKARKNR